MSPAVSDSIATDDLSAVLETWLLNVVSSRARDFDQSRACELAELSETRAEDVAETDSGLLSDNKVSDANSSEVTAPDECSLLENILTSDDKLATEDRDSLESMKQVSWSQQKSGASVHDFLE